MLIERAFHFAAAAHEGQVDRAGVDYFDGHIRAVYENALALSDDPVVHIAAILHDVVEDCDVAIEEIEELFGAEVAEAVALLSKPEDVVAAVYYAAIAENRVARIVKLADLEHNMDLGRIAVVREADLLRHRVYAENYAYLMGV